MLDRYVDLKYHYGVGKVIRDSRRFLKPPPNEMGEGLTFNPDLTFGYIANIGEKPPSQLKLFQMLEYQLKQEDACLRHVRDVEDQVLDFLKLRTSETGTPELSVSLFNREHNQAYLAGMLAKVCWFVQ